MRRIILFVLCLSGISILDAQLNYEKYVWINSWYQYVIDLQTPGNYHLVTSVDKTPSPIFKLYPDAATQLDSLILNVMKEYKNLDWTLDSLKPSLGPAADLPDSLHRQMIFYLYTDQLEALKKPLTIKYFRGKRALYIYDGTGTPDKGFLQIACLTGVCDGFEYGGPLVVSWAATGDTVMDSVRALEAFNRAAEEGMLVRLADDPKWGKPSSVVRCAAPFYGRPAYRIRARVTYDYKFEPERQMRVSDWFRRLWACERFLLCLCSGEGRL